MARPVFLIGLPGCGKTTLGRALAKRMGRGFIDLDLYIENRFHSTIAAMFAAEDGEATFRRRECNMLREVGEMEDVVVACGGGTPCQCDNMEYMNNRGDTVWLQASEDVIYRRLCLARQRRPQFTSLSDVEVMQWLRLLEEQRTPYYSRASITFSGDRLENARLIDESVERFLQTYKSFQES